MGKGKIHDSYTSRIAGRTAMAKELKKPEYSDAIKVVGILQTDLDQIVAYGEKAEQFDRQQRDKLASQRQGMKTKLDLRNHVDSEEEEFRNRLPAVILDLSKKVETALLAGWRTGAGHAERPGARDTGRPGSGNVVQDRV